MFMHRENSTTIERYPINFIQKSAEELKSYIGIGDVIWCCLIRPMVHHKFGDKLTHKEENRRQNIPHWFLYPRSHLWLSELR
jgi:hypothetical protein